MADMTKALGSSESVEWITPPQVLRFAEIEFGRFDMDPCACPGYVHPSIGRSICLPENGLMADWQGNVWMNPPYGELIAPWVEKAEWETRIGHARQVVSLLPARTDTQWWLPCFSAAEWVFFTGRIPFLQPPLFSPDTSAAPFPSIIVVFRRTRRSGTGLSISRVTTSEVMKISDKQLELML